MGKDAVEKITGYRLVLVGGSGVGKLALLVRYTQKTFIDLLLEYDFKSSIETSGRRHVEVDGEPCILDIDVIQSTWSFSPMHNIITRQGDGFLCVFAIDDVKSFEDIHHLQESIKEQKGEDKVPIVLVGNKCDLPAEENVTSERARQCAADMNIPFIEASAKTEVGVEEAFHTLVREIRKDKERKKQQAKKKRKCIIL